MEYTLSISLAAAIILWLILALFAFILGIGAGVLLSMRIFSLILRDVGLEELFTERLEAIK